MASHDTAQSNTENQVELEVAKRLAESVASTATTSHTSLGSFWNIISLSQVWFFFSFSLSLFFFAFALLVSLHESIWAFVQPWASQYSSCFCSSFSPSGVQLPQSSSAVLQPSGVSLTSS